MPERTLAREARDASREAHEARKDLRTELAEAKATVARIREEFVLFAATSAEELLFQCTTKIVDRTQYEQVSVELHATLGEWLRLMGEAKDVLAALTKFRDGLQDPFARMSGSVKGK